MKKRILAIFSAVLCICTLCSCGQNIAKEAEEKGRSYFDSGEYETAAKAFGVAIDNGSENQETALLYGLCLSYYQADKAYKSGALEDAKKILGGVDAGYEKFGIADAINSLKNNVSSTLDARAKLADATAKVNAGDYAGATAVIGGIDTAKLAEPEVTAVNGLKTTIAEAEAAAKAAEEARKKEAAKKAEAAKKEQNKKPAATKPSAPAQGQSVAPAINVNVANDAYIYPTDTQLLTVEQLRTLSASDIALIRNEIYARKGQIFTSAKYINYFSQKTWYTAQKDLRWAEFNDIERKNIMLIKKYESGELK